MKKPPSLSFPANSVICTVLAAVLALGCVAPWRSALGQTIPAAPPAECGWSTAPAMPEALFGNAVTSIGLHLYSFGGVSNGVLTANSYRFDGTNWTPIAPLPVVLSHSSAVTDGTNIYIFGGRNSSGSPTNWFFRYEPAANKYVHLSRPLSGGSSSGLVYLKGKIHKIGGIQNLNFGSNGHGIYDIARDSWTGVTGYPVPVSSMAAFAIGDFVYGVGGYWAGPPEGSPLKAYRYDPATDKWDDAAIADLPARRWDAVATPYEGGAVVAGGYVGGFAPANNIISASVIFWDSASNTWSNLPDMPAGRSEAGGAMLGGIFHVVGGRSPTSPNGVGSNDNQRLSCALPMVGNVSTRLPVGTGDNVLIQGFIVRGPVGSTKKIMVRALGPSLSQFGINDALANPILEIRDVDNVVVAENSDWRTTRVGGIITGDQAGEIAASGLAPDDDLESAIIANLSPGNYTAVVRGAENTTGTGIVDAYDMSAGAVARLTNIATRGLVQPGDKLMIAGFIIQNGSVRAAVRTGGPSLTQFGITNALSDTTLQLRDQNGAIVRENDDWKTDPAQKQELENIGLQPGHDLEAALILTIPPGQYTAQLRGKNEEAGIGVVEVYFPQ